jgi:SAM-dependent methyltransferase
VTRAAARVHPRCHVCSQDDVRELDGFAALRRVTSDCKPWPAGGRLGVCQDCGCIQKALDQNWRDDAERIYRGYTIYHQGGGCEQSVFLGAGPPAARSARFAERLLESVPLPADGRLLDVGCGNGALLRALAEVLPAWRFAGAELDERYRATVESIPRVDAFFSGSTTSFPGSFTAISLMHALEHIADPAGFLSALRPKLDPGGLLIVEVPDCEANPYDLVVADHASHFTSPTLKALVERAGYEVVVCASNWIPKELSLVARPMESREPSHKRPAEKSADIAAGHLAWLQSWRSAALAVAKDVADVGVFGTSIAATWLTAELDGRARFFVDEDVNRIGRVFMDRRVYHPGELSPSAHVLVALPGALAQDVAARLRAAHPRVTWHTPQ